MPRINPEIFQLFSGLGQKIRDTGLKVQSSAAAASGGFSIMTLFIIIIIAVGVYIWYIKYRALYEANSNIQRIIKERTQAAAEYDTKRDTRIDLPTYLAELKKANVPDTHLVFTNFYISTANATGIFLPGKDGVASEYAARAVVAAGARAFVFDIWPDLTPGGNFGPILQVVESGSVWRRISLNSAPFVKILKTIIFEIFESGRPGFNDVVVFYLRFRGTPKRQTFDGVLSALQACIEPYRLDASFNNCRGQTGDSNRLFSTFITSMFKKVVVVSNNLASGHGLNDYINIGPGEGVKLEWGMNEALGLDEQGIKKAITDIQQNIAFVAPLSEDPITDNNDWQLLQYTTSMQTIGIQYIAINFFQPSQFLTDYMSPDLFGSSSYRLKPEKLRYIPMFMTDPKYPQDLQLGTGPTAGTPRTPPAIQMP